jgi:anti-sigma regulatory factor (Ser/Thr protein kinase)
MQVSTTHDRPPEAAPAARSFPGLPASVPEARAFVRAQFAGQDESTVYAAVMCTSELFTNAIAYTASRLPGREVLVMVCAGQAQSTVHVVNSGEVPPCLRMAGGLGQGLQIVGCLASAFGVNGRDWWFTVPMNGAR